VGDLERQRGVIVRQQLVVAGELHVDDVTSNYWRALRVEVDGRLSARHVRHLHQSLQQTMVHPATLYTTYNHGQ